MLRSANRRRGAFALAVAAGVAGQAHAADYFWNTNIGVWNNPFSWLGNAVPGGDTDNVYIGNLPAAVGGTAVLDSAFGEDIGHLYVGQAMTLDLNTKFLWTDTIDLTSGTIRARPVVESPWSAALTGEINIGGAGHVEIQGNSQVRFRGDSVNNGLISGRGEIRALTTSPFVNNGTIRPTNNGGLQLNNSYGMWVQSVDLDGTTGNGTLDLSQPFAALEVNADGLNDAFSGNVLFGFGSTLRMNTGAWDADSNSEFHVVGADNIAASQIVGDHVHFGGQIQTSGDAPFLRFTDSVTYESSAVAEVVNGGLIEFDGPADLEGGYFGVHEDSGVRLDGPTNLYAATFNEIGMADTATVTFNGTTNYDGDINVIMRGVQNGAANVNGPTTLNANIMDMDGDAGSTTWSLTDRLDMLVNDIDSAGDGDTFSGTMNILATEQAHWSLERQGASPIWRIDGDLNLSGFGDQLVDRVSGSTLVMQGDLTVNAGRVQIANPVTLSDDGSGAHVHFNMPGTELSFSGQSRVHTGVTFAGEGTLSNRGSMSLAAGVDLSSAALYNAGELSIANHIQPGTVQAEAFENAAEGEVQISLGGYTQGSEFDALVIGAGGVLLDGELSVHLLDLDFDGAFFAPQVGDEFVIIESAGGVSGMFQSDPVTTLGDLTYFWTVDYEPDAVVLRLEAIVPAPATIAMLAFGMATVARRRRG